MTIRKLIALGGLACLFVTPGAQADDIIRAACEAEASQGFYNCDCTDEAFEALSAGADETSRDYLRDMLAGMMNDKDASKRLQSYPIEAIMGSVDYLDGLYTIRETCDSGKFDEVIAEGEASLAEKQAEYDAIEAAEQARIDAIPTAPPPPEVTDPDNNNPDNTIIAAGGSFTFRDLIIKDCRSFGNSPGYCGCHADETAKLMSPERIRAYVVSSEVEMSTTKTAKEWHTLDADIALRLGTSEQQVRDYRAQWNAMVQSRAYEDIYHACKAYR